MSELFWIIGMIVSILLILIIILCLIGLANKISYRIYNDKNYVVILKNKQTKQMRCLYEGLHYINLFKEDLMRFSFINHQNINYNFIHEDINVFSIKIKGIISSIGAHKYITVDNKDIHLSSNITYKIINPLLFAGKIKNLASFLEEYIQKITFEVISKTKFKKLINQSFDSSSIANKIDNRFLSNFGVVILRFSFNKY